MKWYQKAINRLAATIPQRVRVVVKSAPAGVQVNHDIALTNTAIWAAFKVISETIGSLSVKVYKPEGDKKLQLESNISRLLSVAPNDEMTAQAFYEALTAHCMGWGNAYAEIERDRSGRPVALWPMLPDRTTPKRADGIGLYYEYKLKSGQAVNIRASDVLHIHGFGWDGTTGYDTIAYMTDPIGRALATDEHAGAFFKNGAQPIGALATKEKLSPAAIQNIKESFGNSHGSVKNFFKEVILTEGVEWKSFSISPENSQLLETRKFTIGDIARIWRIPPHMLGDLEKATFSNIEHQGIEFAKYTILPWAIRWEQELNRKVLPAGQYCKFNMASLMRGDMQNRYNAYKIGREWGWLSADDIRALEDMDPIGGIAGAAYIVPLNYQLASDLDKPKEAPAPKPAPPADDAEEDPEDDAADDSKGEAAGGMPENFAPLIEDLIEKAATRIYNALSNKWPRRDQYWPEAAAAEYDKFFIWLADRVDVLNKAGAKIGIHDVDGVAALLNDRPDRSAWEILIRKQLAGGQNV